MIQRLKIAMLPTEHVLGKTLSTYAKRLGIFLLVIAISGLPLAIIGPDSRRFALEAVIIIAFLALLLMVELWQRILRYRYKKSGLESASVADADRNISPVLVLAWINIFLSSVTLMFLLVYFGAFFLFPQRPLVPETFVFLVFILVLSISSIIWNIAWLSKTDRAKPASKSSPSSKRQDRD
jgi:hypothetical protein